MHRWHRCERVEREQVETLRLLAFIESRASPGTTSTCPGIRSK